MLTAVVLLHYVEMAEVGQVTVQVALNSPL